MGIVWRFNGGGKGIKSRMVGMAKGRTSIFDQMTFPSRSDLCSPLLFAVEVLDAVLDRVPDAVHGALRERLPRGPCLSHRIPHAEWESHGGCMGSAMEYGRRWVAGGEERNALGCR